MQVPQHTHQSPPKSHRCVVPVCKFPVCCLAGRSARIDQDFPPCLPQEHVCAFHRTVVMAVATSWQKLDLSACQCPAGLGNPLGNPVAGRTTVGRGHHVPPGGRRSSEAAKCPLTAQPLCVHGPCQEPLTCDGCDCHCRTGETCKNKRRTSVTEEDLSSCLPTKINK